MPLQLRSTLMPSTPAGKAVGYVELFVADHETADQSQEWIQARVKVDEPNVSSLALLQIKSLRTLRDLLTAESERLLHLYQANERPQR
jgi:hypothetical protein